MKLAMLLTVFLLCGGSLFAQETGVILSNSDTTILYYAVDPVFNPAFLTSEDAAEVYTTFDGLRFHRLSPDGTDRHPGLKSGPHALFGFWQEEGAEAQGTWTLVFTVEDGKMKKFIFKKNGAEVVLESGLRVPVKTEAGGRPPVTAIMVDNNYSDWSGAPVLSAFRQSYSPERFKYQTREGERFLPIRDSLIWGRGGTKIESVKALFTAGRLFLYFSAMTPISRGLSIFLYLYPDRWENDRNQYTIEIAIPDETGKGRILLWERNKTASTVIGNYTTANFFLEAEIDLAKLPPELVKNLVEQYSFDLTTSFYDASREAYEEFYFTSVRFSDVTFIR